MTKEISKKRFQKKWPKDEFFEIAKRQSGKGFTINNKDRLVLMNTGNLKKWISFKYYGSEE